MYPLVTANTPPLSVARIPPRGILATYSASLNPLAVMGWDKTILSLSRNCDGLIRPYCVYFQGGGGELLAGN